MANNSLTPTELHELQETFNFVRDHALERNDQKLHDSAQACFDMRSLDRLKRYRNNILADQLELLQKKHNDGRGISCVRQIAAAIARHDIEGAKVHIHNEWDKIANYPDICEYLQKQGLAEKDWYFIPDSQ